MKRFLQIIFVAMLAMMSFLPIVSAQNDSSSSSSFDRTVTNVNNVDLQASRAQNAHLKEFAEGNTHFIQPDSGNVKNWVNWLFVNIAFDIKNFVIFIAVIFLIIGVIKLLFSDASDEDVKKWKNNVFWTAAGIFFMQISYSIWQTGTQMGDKGNPINAALSWTFWHNIIEPILQLLQYLASFAFLAMMIYAFYVMVTGNGDDKKLETGKKTFLYGLVGFLMIQLPYAIVKTFYRGVPECQNTSSTLWSFTGGTCVSEGSVGEKELSEGVELIAKIFTYFNGFLTLLCVIMAIYAGWLFLISKGDENKTGQAKRIVLYIAIGLIILVASHAIFRFFLVPTGN